MYRAIARLIIASMLFVSVEGVADSVAEMNFHQAHHAHTDDAGAQWFPDSDGNAHEGDACEHFCHAHVVGLAAQLGSAAPPHFQNYAAAPPARIVTHSVAPPTPPPNL